MADLSVSAVPDFLCNVVAMDQHSTTLRAAKPTLEEGFVFALYVEQAAEGFFRFMFGPRFAGILAKAYTKPGHDLSFQNVIFAEQGNVIVGMASGFTAEQHRQSSEKPLRQAAEIGRAHV